MIIFDCRINQVICSSFQMSYVLKSSWTLLNDSFHFACLDEQKIEGFFNFIVKNICQVPYAISYEAV